MTVVKTEAGLRQIKIAQAADPAQLSEAGKELQTPSSNSKQALEPKRNCLYGLARSEVRRFTQITQQRQRETCSRRPTLA